MPSGHRRDSLRFPGLAHQRVPRRTGLADHLIASALIDGRTLDILKRDDDATSVDPLLGCERCWSLALTQTVVVADVTQLSVKSMSTKNSSSGALALTL